MSHSHMCKKSFKIYHEVDLPIYVQIRQQPPNSHQHARRWVYIGSTHSGGNLHQQDNGLHPNPILQLPLTNWEKRGQPINHTYRPINNIFTNLPVLNLCWPFYWPNGIICHRFLDFPEIKGIFPKPKKLWNLTKFRLVRNPREIGAADPACRKLELVRIDQLHTLDTKPTKVRTSHGGSVQQRQWLRSPMGLRGWLVYIFTLHENHFKKMQAFMWVRHILPVLWDGIGKWKLDPLNGRYILQGTNISQKKCILKMIFLFPRWDMLIPGRVYHIYILKSLII